MLEFKGKISLPLFLLSASPGRCQCRCRKNRAKAGQRMRMAAGWFPTNGVVVLYNNLPVQCYNGRDINVEKTIKMSLKKQFCLILIGILVVILLTSCGVDQNASEGLEFSPNEDGTGYCVTGIGNCTDTDLIISSTYNGRPVTRIAEKAFVGCTTLKSITIPDSVKSIGDYVFYGCTGLTSITIPNSVTSIGSAAFYGCTALKSITIPDSVTSIGEGTFLDCTNLTNITIPDGVTSIGDCAFYGCTSLTGITIPNSVTSIGIGTFYDCTSLTSITIPFVGATKRGNTDTYFGYIFGAESYSDQSKYVPTSLKKVVVTDGSSIGDRAFYGCTSLTSITIPNSVTSIDNFAFSGCTSLTSITIPNGLTRIGSSAFSGCTSLTSITIPGSVTSIGKSAFYNCTSLTSITIPFVGATKDGKTNTHFGYIFGAESYSDHSKYVPTSLKTVVITGGSSIGDRAFSGCTSLTSITIPGSVTNIGSATFYGCTSLTSITIPGKVTNIGEYAFFGCASLKSITVPDGVISIGHSAFEGCTSLTSITIPGSVTSIGSKAFSNTGYYNEESNWENGVLYIGKYLIEAKTSKSGSCTVKAGTKLIADYAFINCESLTDIVIPSSVLCIGNSAFYNCTSLTSITIPFVGAIKDGKTNTHFGYIFGAESYSDHSKHVPTSLKTVVITGGSSIGDRAFYGCTNLASITIPNSVTSIGVSAFYGCTSLTSITIPGSVMSIGNSAFKDCTSLTSITIPGSVTSIGSSAFSGCTSLTSITIPFVGATKDGKTNTHFGYIFGAESYSDHSKYVPTSLKTVIITGGSSIGDRAFYGCTSLTSITIPSSVTSIGWSAFSDCTSLTSITIPDSVTSIGSKAFSNTGYYNKESNWENGVLYIGKYLIEAKTSKFGSCTVKAGTKLIADYAFFDCESLTGITISDSMTSIGGYAFYGCKSLTSITIPDGVTSIDDSAFMNCTNLTSITIPDSVLSINSWAFSGCTKLTSITFKGTKAQWNAISKGSGWNLYTGSYIIHCTDGDIKK